LPPVAALGVALLALVKYRKNSIPNGISAMKIAALCSTYKRPELLGNTIACFLAQATDIESRLFILDDAAQFRNQKADRFEIESTPWRYGKLSDKHNHLAATAIAWGADVLTVWDDDDVFLPWHLANAGLAISRGVSFVRTPRVYSNSGLPKDGSTQLKDATGLFHSSWSFTVAAFNAVGGYPKTGRLDFDQQLNRKLCEIDPVTPNSPTERVLAQLRPSYVYRWGNGQYNVSQAGEGGFKVLWDKLGRLPAPFIESPNIVFDAETTAIYDRLVKSS
jgi:hypothetical protein